MGSGMEDMWKVPVMATTSECAGVTIAKEEEEKKEEWTQQREDVE